MIDNRNVTVAEAMARQFWTAAATLKEHPCTEAEEAELYGIMTEIEHWCERNAVSLTELEELIHPIPF